MANKDDKKPISLRHAILCTTYLEDEVMCFFRKTNEICELTDSIKYKYNQYKDYVILPKIKEEDLYNLFLDEFHFTKIKKELNNSDNFLVNFRCFIERNYFNGMYLLDQYRRFEINYIKPIIIDWCNKNRIKYIDDTEKT